MIQVPVSLGIVGNPVLAGSKGHMIIQWGGSLIGVPEVASGALALQSVPPANMYSIPGSEFVGLGLC